MRNTWMEVRERMIEDSKQKLEKEEYKKWVEEKKLMLTDTRLTA